MDEWMGEWGWGVRLGAGRVLERGTNDILTFPA